MCGFGLARAREVFLGQAGRRDHSRLPYLKRARECAFPVKWSLIPLPTKNEDRFPMEPWTTSNGMLDRFLWNHRTTSTGIRSK